MRGEGGGKTLKKTKRTVIRCPRRRTCKMGLCSVILAGLLLPPLVGQAQGMVLPGEQGRHRPSTTNWASLYKTQVAGHE